MDAGCFHAADPEGVLIADIGGDPSGCVSAMRCGAGFGFLGVYIVRPGFRGQGHGLALWRAAMARLAGGAVGLDGVVALQANYRRSGFALLHRTIRCGTAAPRPPAPAGLPEAVPAASLPFADIAAFDRRHFSAPREALLRGWLAAPGHVARAVAGPVFLDLPEPNADAIAMATEAGMAPVFETARMCAGPAPALPLGRIYGITSLELGGPAGRG